MESALGAGSRRFKSYRPDNTFNYFGTIAFEHLVFFESSANITSTCLALVFPTVAAIAKLFLILGFLVAMFLTPASHRQVSPHERKECHVLNARKVVVAVQTR